MHRAIKTVFITGLALCMIGGGIYAIGAAAGGRTHVQKTGLDIKYSIQANQDGETKNQTNDSTKKSKELKTFYQEKTQLDSIRSLTVDFKHIDFKIKPSGDQHYYLKYTIDSKTQGNPLQIQSENGVLTMTEREAEASTFYIRTNIDFLDKMLGTDQQDAYTSLLILYIPEDNHLTDCTFQMGKGDMEIKGLQTDSMNLSMDEEGLKLTDSILQNSQIFLEVGDVTGKNISFRGDSTIKTDGDIKITMDSANADDLSIHAKAKDGDIETSKHFSGNITEKGDASIYQYQSGNGAHELNLISTDGDISIN